MKKCNWIRKAGIQSGVVVALLAYNRASAYAQSGKDGITKATTEVTGYFGVGTSLMYAVGAILGLIGAIKVYTKWNSGDPDTSKVAASWFGSCIFLVVVATVIQSFFGIK